MCGGAGKFSEFQIDFLETHNSYREKHGSPRMELDKSLCQFAQSHADFLASCDILMPSKKCTFGENIYFKCSDRKIYPDPIEPVVNWYEEGENFTSTTDYPSKDIKHFVQMIWRSTRILGVGYALNSDETKLYVVANYYPAGNDYDSFCDNVKPLYKNFSNMKKCPSIVKVI